VLTIALDLGWGSIASIGRFSRPFGSLPSDYLRRAGGPAGSLAVDRRFLKTRPIPNRPDIE